MTKPTPATVPGTGPATWFPVMLDLRGRPVLVVGGGTVAQSKVYQLLDAHAAVTLVAPRVTERIAEWVDLGKVRWLDRRFEPDHVEGTFIVIAATDDAVVNRAVWLAADAAAIPVNAADDPDNCSFILPAAHQTGDLTLTVSTAGHAPALAVRIRDRLAAEFDTAYGDYVALLGAFRHRIKRHHDDFEARRRLWYRIVDDPQPLGLVRRGDLEAAAAAISSIIERDSTRVPEGAGR